MNLANDQIEEMTARKNDLEFQLSLTKDIMEKNEILPFPFHRSVILLVKAKRYQEALNICEYFEEWCSRAQAGFKGHTAKLWRSPKLEDLITRIPIIRQKLVI